MLLPTPSLRQISTLGLLRSDQNRQPRSNSIVLREDCLGTVGSAEPRVTCAWRKGSFFWLRLGIRTALPISGAHVDSVSQPRIRRTARTAAGRLRPLTADPTDSKALCWPRASGHAACRPPHAIPFELFEPAGWPPSDASSCTQLGMKFLLLCTRCSSRVRSVIDVG